MSLYNNMYWSRNTKICLCE